MELTLEEVENAKQNMIECKLDYCIECLEKDITIKQELQTVEENRKIVFYMPYVYCNSCGEKTLPTESREFFEEMQWKAGDSLLPREVKRIRKTLPKKYSQTNFAKLCGVSLASVSRWELGKERPNPAYSSLIIALRDIQDVYKFLYNRNMKEI
jgi:DNA-binding transcriptional regulator YiaG